MEKIICSAIWAKDMKKGVHNPKNIFKGYVIAGRRHCNCIETLSFIDDNCGKRKDIEQGFLTSENRYVDRKEGATIAFNAYQIDKMKDTLYSEDIY